ncbi:MAG: ribonuclease P protein component [Treponema sp.]|nr:ribonuclease P protein component [Treponema sp.]
METKSALLEGEIPQTGNTAGGGTAGASFRFRPEEHLKGRIEIRDVFRRGKQFCCRGAKLFVLKNSVSHNRICFTFSRGFGNAVARNRARRLGREAYRHLRPSLRGGHDLILLMYSEAPAVSTLFTGKESGAAARGKFPKSGFAARMEQQRYLFFKAGLLQ